MMRATVLLAMSGALAACGTPGPGAEGTLTVPSDDPSEFATLELRFYADPDEAPIIGGPPPIPAGETMLVDSISLSTVTFPYAYSIAMPIGTSKVARWRLVVWLATPATQTWLSGDEPHATAKIQLDDCGRYYCDTTSGVDLALQRPATGG